MLLRIHSHWEVIPMNNVCPTWFAMGFRRWSSRPHVTPKRKRFPKKTHQKMWSQLGMSVKLKWGKESDRLIGNGPLLPSLTSQLCKWKSKLEMSSPLVPKTIHKAAANFVETLSLPLPYYVEQQIYGLGGQSILHYILSSSQVRKSFMSMVI